MRIDASFSLFALCLAVGGCAADSPTLLQGSQPSFSVVPGGCSPAYLTTGVEPPINADGTSIYQLGRTIPVKARYTACDTGEDANTLAPLITLALVGDGGGTEVEIESSSAADAGNTMRSAGSGQYIFNLSTKRSQFNGGLDLVPGRYHLTISGANLQQIDVEFTIRS